MQFQLDPEKLKKTVDAMELFKQEESIEQEVPDQPGPVPKIMKERQPSETEDDGEVPEEEEAPEEEQEIAQ